MFPDPAAPGLIPTIPEIQTHRELASGNLVQQKVVLKTVKKWQESNPGPSTHKQTKPTSSVKT